MTTHRTREPKHHGRPGITLPEDTKAEILRLYDEGGLSQTEIARRTRTTRDAVRGVCARAGRTDWNRAKTAVATEAHKVDMAARRAELAQGLLDDVARLRAQLFAPVKVFNIGGKDNIYTEHEIEEQPVEGKLKLMQAVGAAIDRHLKLDAHDTDHGAEDAKSLLTNLGRALGVTAPDA